MELDRRDLKIQALLEKISELTMKYENSIADLRVELTLEKSQADEQIRSLQEALAQKDSDEVPTSDSAQEQG